MSIDAKPAVPDARWVEVPRDALSSEALVGVVDEYITREGTEYGEREYTLAEKRESALRQLELGEIIIVYEPENGSTTLVTKRLSQHEPPPDVT